MTVSARSLVCTLVTVGLTASCEPNRTPARGGGARVDGAAPDAVQVDTTASMERSPALEPSTPVQDATHGAPVSWAVTPTGAGGLRIGMEIGELMPRMEQGADPAAIGAGCEYVRIAGAPHGLEFMVEGRRLARIDVRDGGTPTAEGARIGDSEERIVGLYPGARQRPHKYTDGNYLIVVPGAPSDTVHRYVFETDGREVTSYRAGAFPPVEYVEGCS